ncbi:hypothetical protein BC829DRAFT_176050 [Chytridium lagenaria]|nr:hypothetical protein BC829DRAFT_176050 [Chytridium lagenaria]
MHGRRWIPLPSARPADPTFTFTIMTWNILAQCLIKRELFPYILAKGKTSPLSAKHRIPIIIQHLYDLQPDIAALQEVDGDIWGDQIASRMKELGYDFVLTLKNPLKKVGHGLVVMWKIDKLEPYLLSYF